MLHCRFPGPTPLAVILVALATAACREATAPATAGSKATAESPANAVVSAAVVVKPKKNKPVIESVQLSTTSLELNAALAATYDVTIYNPFGRASRTYIDAYLQGEIRQGGVVAATGGFAVRCNGGPIAELPSGKCIVNGLTINTIGGAAVLVPGGAEFALTLHSTSEAFPTITVTVPVILGEALVTP